MKNFFITTVAALALGSLAGCADAPETAPPPMSQAAHTVYSAEAFFQTKSYGLPPGDGIAFSAVTGDVLVTSDESGVFNAYRLRTETGERSALTDSTTNPIFPISWFPTDERVLFSQDGGGDELTHVFVRAADGTVRDLTPGDAVKASFLRWSDDGETFYLLSNERDAKTFDVYAYAADDYSRSLVFQNNSYDVAAISGDGRYVALTKERTSADSDVYVADLMDTGGPVLVTAHQGNIAHSAYGFSSDSARLYYGTNEGGEFTRAVEYELDSGDKSDAMAADWDVTYYGESPSGQYTIGIVNADATGELTLTDRQTGENIRMKNVPDGEIRNVRFNADETRAAFIVNSSTSPSNIYVADLTSGEATVLTDALNPAINPDMLVDSTVARFESYDGLEVPGILYRPKTASAANPAPALVLVHGGPGGQTRRGYSAMVQHLVNHGYAVYGINNRGSSGYGKTFYHLDDKRHGDVDLKDVVASKDFLAEMDWIDGERIGIMGGSYGGYMVAAALAFEPEVFDVGVNIFGVTNWVRTLESIPPWWESFREALFDEMGDPATDAERHRAISPLFHADNIVKPMLVVQGANDPRVLQVESDELVAAIRANDVPVEYVLFDDEGHGFRKRENRITASTAYVEFLDIYLK
jgi:dipeptidyl aminopeptidase/acylaminoacyl peptidase